MKKRKAVSPLVSTVLLIMIVVVLALIIIMWSGVFFKEALTKEIFGNKKTAEQYCSEISVEAILNDDGKFGLRNTGNVPIYAINLQLSGEGSSDIVKIEQGEGGRINPSYSSLIQDSENFEGDGDGYFDYNKYEKIKLIPIILAKSKSGKNQEYQCPERNAIII